MSDTIRDPGSVCPSPSFLSAFCPQAAPAAATTSASSFLEEAREKQPMAFALTLRRQSHLLSSRPPLTSHWSESAKGVRPFEWFSLVLILRPMGSRVLHWLLKQMAGCAGREAVGGGGGHSCWAGTLACCRLGGENWLGTHCSRLISWHPWVLVAPKTLGFSDKAT